MMDRNGTVNFLIGLGAGLALGVLYAPQRGEDLRRLVTNRTKEGAEEIKARASDFYDSAAGLAESGRAEIARQQEGVKQAVKAGKMAYQQTAG